MSKSFYQALLSGAVCLVILSSFSAAAANTNHGAVEENTSFEPRATFERLWVDYDITQSGQKGMLIHVKFTAYDLKNASCLIGVYFQDKNGNPLKDYNKRFYTTQGNVAVTKQLTPGYNPANYEDLQLFMPYEELDLLDGSYDLQMDVDLLYNDGEMISHLTTYPFAYTRGNKTSTNTTSNKPGGKLNRVWVDYDVFEKNRKGMRIHVNFSAYNMKGVDSYLAVYVQKRDGTPLRTNNSEYSSKNGDVAIYYSMKPGYNPADYSDAQLFIPYDELNLNRGKHDLRLDVDLIYENGTLIEHIGVHDFWYDTGK